MSMRKYARAIAKANMERAGMKKVNKSGKTKKRFNQNREDIRSTFAKKWRLYAE